MQDAVLQGEESIMEFNTLVSAGSFYVKIDINGLNKPVR